MFRHIGTHWRFFAFLLKYQWVLTFPIVIARPQQNKQNVPLSNWRDDNNFSCHLFNFHWRDSLITLKEARRWIKGFPSLEICLAVECRFQGNDRGHFWENSLVRQITERWSFYKKDWLCPNNEGLIIQNVWKNTCSQSKNRTQKIVPIFFKAWNLNTTVLTLWTLLFETFFKRINLFDRASKKEIKTSSDLVKVFVWLILHVDGWGFSSF